jgi:putative PIN family toxin of toxin-antitoxin system
MLRAVLDVNVLVSAAIMGRGIPHALLVAWQAGRFTLITSEHIITQLTIKLRSDKLRRYGLSTADIRAVTNLLRKDAVVVTVPADEIRPVTGDQEDDAVLATARQGEAGYLVTGDTRLLNLSPYEGIQVLTSRAFLTLIEANLPEDR